MATQLVCLIRHGETEWTLSGQHTGTTDLPLTPRGTRGAQRLQPVLAREHFALVLTSPLWRARQTCELAGLAEHARIDDDLMEWDYGWYEGLSSREIRKQAPGWRLFTDGCPGGERPRDIRTRVDRLIRRCRAVPGHVALVAHGHLFRVFAARWLGLPASAGSHFLLDTASLSILSYSRGVAAINRWNTVLGPTSGERSRRTRAIAPVVADASVMRRVQWTPGTR